MVKKKISKWEKNLEKVKRAQKRAQSLIFDLQYQGYQISKGQYDLVFRPLKSRYTEAEAKKYISLVSAQRIKSYATNVYGMKASQRVAKLKQREFAQGRDVKAPRFRETIAVRRGHEYEDVGRAFYKHMLYAMENYPRLSIDKMIYDVFRIMKNEGYQLTKERMRHGRMLKYLQSINEDEFVKAYSTLMENQNEDIEAIRQLIYSTGRTSQEAYESRKKINYIRVKKIFGEYAGDGFTEDDADFIFDFFKNSRAWNVFKKKYLDSDQPNYWEIAKECAEAASEYGINVVDGILSNAQGVEDALNKLRKL